MGLLCAVGVLTLLRSQTPEQRAVGRVGAHFGVRWCCHWDYEQTGVQWGFIFAYFT